MQKSVLHEHFTANTTNKQRNDCRLRTLKECKCSYRFFILYRYYCKGFKACFKIQNSYQGTDYSLQALMFSLYYRLFVVAKQLYAYISTSAFSSIGKTLSTIFSESAIRTRIFFRKKSPKR